MSLVHTRFFLPLPPSCPSSSVTMGKVCVSHDTLLITDNDSTTQDDKSLPPCMQLQARVGFNFLPSNTNPPPRLQLRDRVGFFPPFFRSMNDDDDDEPCRLVVVICLHMYPRQPNQPPPRLQLRDGGGFYHHFFEVKQRKRPRHAM